MDINRIIDVVIPAHRKDLPTLPYCVKNAWKNIRNVGRVIVVSKDKLTDNAEWFDEINYPFQKKDIAVIAKKIGHYGVGWYYQQLLKMYAPLVIPNISSNVLVLDSDSVFYRKVNFIDEEGRYLFNKSKEYVNFGTDDFLQSSRKFVKTMLPELNTEMFDGEDKKSSGVAHHMIFSRKIMLDLFDRVCKVHKKKEFWKIFMEVASKKGLHSASEYELYFVFMLNFYKDKITRRILKYKNTHDINWFKYFGETLRKKYHYCAYHNRDYQMKE
jgi:hypothetical protein